jgi:2'-5' RNA ligase
MRLLGRDELHLTVHFLGEVQSHHDELVRTALASVEARPFSITLAGLGTFPSDGQPKVLWSGMEPCPALFALHAAIGTALTAAIGFQPELRPYMPHITLARLNDSVQPGFIERHMERHRSFRVASVQLNRFALYSSVFEEEIPRYRQEAVFYLSNP